MQKSITALLAVALWVVSPWAVSQSDIKLQDNAPDRYVVVRGDTLWGISGKFLKDPWHWPEVWRMNKEQIKNPHFIYPGDVIVLDRSTTPPQLRLERDGQATSPEAKPLDNDTVKLSPRMRSENLAGVAIPPISSKSIDSFLSQPLVIEDGGLNAAPRVIATEADRYNLGATGIAYVRGLKEAEGSVWQIYRQGQPLVDPDNNKILGYEAVYRGTARITKGGDPATVQIVNSKKEVSAGDHLILAAAPSINQYIPHTSPTPIAGRIIGLYDGLTTSEGGRDSIFSINRGQRDGIEIGQVFALYRTVTAIDQADLMKSRERAQKIKLPDERYGLILIFRTFDTVSYGLVMDSSNPVRPGDMVRNP